ncbi:MAG TPA: GntR family transcriptional regulator [Steroidobacteraceae bacterium]|nr:GntR family transcriptional regulator [Steroidobacteraceae bacterium]
MASSVPLSGKGRASRRIKRGQGFVDEVYELIRADIMSLRVPPDTRLSIDSLARQLGVSQTPIREALSRLEATGLVIKQHFVGYCSAPRLNRQQLDELYELRLLLEPYAARCAAERMTDEELRAVTELARKMEPDESRTSYDRFAVQDSEFHDLIAIGSRNPLIRDTLAGLHTHLHIFRLRFHSEVTKEAFAEHAGLIAALVERRPAAAAAAMRAHIEKSYQRLKAYTQDR